MTTEIYNFFNQLLLKYYKYIPNYSKDYIEINKNNQIIYFYNNIKLFNIKSIEGNNQELAKQLQFTIENLKLNGITLKNLNTITFKDIQNKLDLFSAYLNYEKFKQKNHLYDKGDLENYIYELIITNNKIKQEIKLNFKNIFIKNSDYLSTFQLKIINLIFDSKIKQQKIINSNIKPKLIETKNNNSQISYILDKIESLTPKTSLGIILNSNNQITEILTYLDNLEIDYNYDFNINLFQNNYIQQIFNLLKIANDPNGSSINIFNLLQNLNIRNQTKQKISRASSLNEKSIYKVLLSKTKYSDFEDENIIINSLSIKLEELVNLRYSKTKLIKIINYILIEFNIYKQAILENNKVDIQIINLFLNFSNNYINTFKNNNFQDFIIYCNNFLDLNLKTRIKNIQNNINITLTTINNSNNYFFNTIIIPNLNWGEFPEYFKSSFFENQTIINSKQKFEENEFNKLIKLIKNSDTSYLLYKKYSNTNFQLKPSKFLNIFKTNVVVYNKILENDQLSNKEKIEIELISKLNINLLNKNYNQAENDLHLLKSLFQKKKDLSLFSKNNEDYNYYLSKLKNVNEITEESKNLIINPDKMVYSVSQLKTYQSCPKKYLYSYIYKIPSLSKHFFDFGTTIHSVLEDIAKKITPETDEALFLSKSLNLLKKYWISKGYENVEQEKLYFEKAVKLLKNFIIKQKQLSILNRIIVAEEKQFLIKLSGKKIYGIIDRIDKVDDTYEILDYKTSNSMIDQKKLKTDIQLIIYALALKQDPNLFKQYPKKIGLWYLIHDKITLIDFDETITNKIKLDILKIIEKIENSNFKPMPSKFNCDYCDYSNICPNKFK